MRKRKLAITAVVIILTAAAIGLFAFLRAENDEPEVPETAPSQLTGIEVAPELSRRPVLAVIYDNLEPARPQTGLDAAGIFFEAVTESDITRYLALFQENMPEEVGPIRSLRTFFLDWAMGFDASIAHVGGSAQALQLADQRNVRSLDQFKHSAAYQRDENVPTPHNVYANT